MKWNVFFLMLVLGTGGDLGADGGEGILRIDPAKVIRTFDRHELLGSNVALWHDEFKLNDPVFRGYLKDLKPGFLRMPGGSWSDEYYWNGNGVRDGENFDLTKLRDGKWAVDLSGYAPGFRIQGAERGLSDYHGVTDVLNLHRFVGELGA
jgi:hypothetical protein